ncbi:MAG: ABC transporter permease [Nitrososphaerota archaeon]|nr:ABC transporter permease [Nitrososphaerota archaeon]
MIGVVDVKKFLVRRWKDLGVITGNWSGKIGFAITAAFVIVVFFAQWIAPYSPTRQFPVAYAPPSFAHLLVTDDIGEDLFSQLIWAARGSFIIGVFAGAIATVIGTGIGLLSGYHGGRTGEGLMRFTDVVLVLPLLPLLLVIASVFPANVILVIGVIGFLSWPSMARVIRSQTLTLKTRPFVDAAKLSGMSDSQIMLTVLLPNMLPLVVLYGVYAAVTAVVIEAGLDYIGLGAVTNLSLGTMLYFALSRNALLIGAWWWFIPPGLLIAVLGIGFILLAHGVERIGRVRS